MNNITSASQLRANLTSRVKIAENDPKEAKKIFGVDRMTTEQRRVALRHTAIVSSFRSPK